MIARHFLYIACLCGALLTATMLSACGDTPTDPGDPTNGEEREVQAVENLADIDGSWNQIDDQNRFLVIDGEEGEMGAFHEAVFQEGEDCYVHILYEVVGVEDALFTVRVTENGEDEREEELEFDLVTVNGEESIVLRNLSTGFEAEFDPSSRTLEDLEPQCTQIEDEGQPVTSLEEIDGSWELENGDEGFLVIDGTEERFDEAIFQDEDACYLIREYVLVSTDENRFTFDVTAEGEEEREEELELFLIDENGEQLLHVRNLTRDEENIYRPSERTLDDAEPRCEADEPVTDLSDIDGSWQQEDEPRRYLDIRSDEGDLGIFYEAFFQDDEDEFEETDCFAVVENEVVGIDDNEFTIRVHEEGEEPVDVTIRFEVVADDNNNTQRIRLSRLGDEGEVEFEAIFVPTDLTVDDYEPRCAENSNGDNQQSMLSRPAS